MLADIILDQIYQKLNNILKQISEKYNIDHEELKQLYLSKFPSNS